MLNKKKRTKIPGRVRKARSSKYKFSVKNHPIEGILSFAAGIISFIVLLISCYFAWQNRGTSGLIIGLFGVMAFFMSVAGLTLAFMALRKKDIHLRFPVLGGVLNGVLTIVYLVIYVMGTLL